MLYYHLFKTIGSLNHDFSLKMIFKLQILIYQVLKLVRGLIWSLIIQKGCQASPHCLESVNYPRCVNDLYFSHDSYTYHV